jgi:hypothetical protein
VVEQIADSVKTQGLSGISRLAPGQLQWPSKPRRARVANWGALELIVFE